MRRIVVTLDAIEVSEQALEHAVQLADRMGAFLEGIFVEDIDLIEISSLPFARELRPVSRSENVINLVRMEQELRALARRAERRLSEQAARHNVTWSFRIWRGSIDNDLLAADLEADVLALSRLGAPLKRSTAVCKRSASVTLLFTGSEASTRALDIAKKLASDPDRELVILLPVADKEEALRLQESAADQLQGLAASAHFVQMAERSIGELLEILADANSAVLIIERDTEYLRMLSRKQSLNLLTCPLLVVR